MYLSTKRHYRDNLNHLEPEIGYFSTKILIWYNSKTIAIAKKSTLSVQNVEK